jgi:hypothetical protein
VRTCAVVGVVLIPVNAEPSIAGSVPVRLPAVKDVKAEPSPEKLVAVTVPVTLIPVEVVASLVLAECFKVAEVVAVIVVPVTEAGVDPPIVVPSIVPPLMSAVPEWTTSQVALL